MASFPGSIPVLSTITDPSTITTSMINTPNGEIVAICTALGTNPATIDDTQSAASDPLSLYLSFLANVTRQISGAPTWDQSAVRSRCILYGSGSGATIAIGAPSVRYLSINGSSLQTVENQAQFPIGYSCKGMFFAIEMLDSMSTGSTPGYATMNIKIRKNGGDFLALDDFMTAGSPAGVYFWRYSFASVNTGNYAVNDTLSIKIDYYGDATSGASPRIGGWSFGLIQNG